MRYYEYDPDDYEIDKLYVTQQAEYHLIRVYQVDRLVYYIYEIVDMIRDCYKLQTKYIADSAHIIETNVSYFADIESVYEYILRGAKTFDVRDI